MKTKSWIIFGLLGVFSFCYCAGNNNPAQTPSNAQKQVFENFSSEHTQSYKSHDLTLLPHPAPDLLTNAESSSLNHTTHPIAAQEY